MRENDNIKTNPAFNRGAVNDGVNKHSQTLGDILRQRREEMNLNIKDIVKQLQTSQKFIRALEDNHYDVFSAKVYARGFLQKILKILAIEEKDELFKEFEREWEVRIFRKKRDILSLHQNNTEKQPWNIRQAGVAAAGLIILVFFIFLTIRIKQFVSSPILELNEPAQNSVIFEPVVNVRGRTEKESQLTVNGREVRIDTAGNFSDEIDLLPGLNELEFVVENRFGKMSKVIRYVVVK